VCHAELLPWVNYFGLLLQGRITHFDKNALLAPIAARPFLILDPSLCLCLYLSSLVVLPLYSNSLYALFPVISCPVLLPKLL